VHSAGCKVLFPGSKAGRARRQRQAVLRALQRQLGAAAFREVDDNAKVQRTTLSSISKL